MSAATIGRAVMPGANSKRGRGGARAGAGRPIDIDLERLVVDLCTSLGSQRDARVNPDRIADSKIVRGQPWSAENEQGVDPESVREAARMVARRRLADHPFDLKTRGRMERSLAERIRRAYYRAQKQSRGDEPWREIEVGPAEEGILSVAIPYEDDED